MAGGDTVDAYVKLEAPAPAGGVTVYPISYYDYVIAPAVVVVPAGEIWGTFPVATTAVSRHRYVFISMTGEDSLNALVVSCRMFLPSASMRKSVVVVKLSGLSQSVPYWQRVEMKAMPPSGR